jgi:hypothetical protein
VNLPPAIRELQQSWVFHIVTATGVAAGMTVFTCFNSANDFTFGCLKGGLIFGGVYLFGSLQHSPGSASFHTDGYDNKAVEAVAAVTQAMPGPEAEKLKVSVVKS